MKRYTQLNGRGRAFCRANPCVSPFLNDSELVCGEAIERLAWFEDKTESGELGDIKQLKEKIEALLCEHEKQYSHLCKSKKECHDETCRYLAVLKLHNEIKELFNEQLQTGAKQ